MPAQISTLQPMAGPLQSRWIFPEETMACREPERDQGKTMRKERETGTVVNGPCSCLPVPIPLVLLGERGGKYLEVKE